MRDECEHGMLRRKCDRCEEQAELERLRTRLAESEAEVAKFQRALVRGADSVLTARALAAEAERDEAWSQCRAARADNVLSKAERDDLLGALRDVSGWVMRRGCPDHWSDSDCANAMGGCEFTLIVAKAQRVLSGEKEGAPAGWSASAGDGRALLEITASSAEKVGFRAGAEWMREQAARAVESTEEYSLSVAVKMAPSDHLACAVSRVRSLPASPPAPEEAP